MDGKGKKEDEKVKRRGGNDREREKMGEKEGERGRK